MLAVHVHVSGVHEGKLGLDRPVGYSALLVDQRIYKELTSDTRSAGIRINTLPIQVIKHGKIIFMHLEFSCLLYDLFVSLQGDRLRTIGGKLPSVGLVLRLITNQVSCYPGK